MTAAPFPVDEVRRQFPALDRGDGFIFFDNAAGAQVPARVVEAVTNHLVRCNVQRGGVYRHSRQVDQGIARARESVAALVNARGPDEIAFGLNATSFIRSISLAVGQTLAARPEIVVSDLDHEANVATWLALERVGARIVWWPIRSDGLLHVADLRALVGERTRLVACTMASNATGTIVDVRSAAAAAHAVGAELFLDAVHFAPHRPIDVQAIGADYLVCSGYKLFSPHMGFAWCRREAINRLPTFREEFIPDVTAEKLEAGTYAYENVAGMDAAVEYLERLGSEAGVGGEGQRRGSEAGVGGEGQRRGSEAGVGGGGQRRVPLERAMTAIAAYERELSSALIETIERVPGAAIYGITDRRRLDDRVPTVSFTIAGVDSGAIADALARANVAVRSGHMYAPRLMARLGVPPGGLVRASLVHYNTAAEIARFGEVLESAVAGVRC